MKCVREANLNWYLKCVIINLKYNEKVSDLLTILYINHQITTDTDVERHKNEAKLTLEKDFHESRWCD